jgi:hypothetical protein
MDNFVCYLSLIFLNANIKAIKRSKNMIIFIYIHPINYKFFFEKIRIDMSIEIDAIKTAITKGIQTFID